MFREYRVSKVKRVIPVTKDLKATKARKVIPEKALLSLIVLDLALANFLC